MNEKKPKNYYVRIRLRHEGNLWVGVDKKYTLYITKLITFKNQ